MAHIVYKSGIKKSLPHKQAVILWKTLRNTNNLTPAQKAKVSQIEAVYLNYREAPDEYVEENLRRIIPMVVGGWIVDVQGKPLRPQGREDLEFAKRWGLWFKGKPTDLALRPATTPVQVTISAVLPPGDR
jgi:hypothetical protein